MSNAYEQDVILDADGQPIFAALDRVQRQVEAINRDVVATSKALGVQLTNMGTMLENQSRAAQQRMSQIQSLAKANNFAGFQVQNTDQRRRLGQLTTQVTEYGRGLETASNSVEAFQTRLNRLNDTIAERGRLGRGETLTQTRQRKALEEQKRAVIELDRAMENLQRRASRTSLTGADRGQAQLLADRLTSSRAGLFSALQDPSRRSFLPEIERVRRASRAMDDFYVDIRGKQAQRLTDERATARAIERAEISSLDSRAKQEEQMWAQRERAHTSRVKKANDIERAYARDENKRLSDRDRQMEAMWSAEEKSLQRRLSKRVQLSEAEKLGMDEAARQNFGGLDAQQAARLQRQQNAAQLDDMKAASVARAKELRDVAAVNSARAQSAMRLNELRAARRAATNPQDHDYLTRQIKGEQAYTAALRQRRTELERIARAEARAQGVGAAGGAGRGRDQGSPISNIMTPGYMGAAVARTGVYGAGAMAVYAAFDTIRGGFQYVTELEDGLAKLQAIADATDGQMVQLKTSILDVADSSRFSTVELVKISQNLAQAGVSASQMKDALESVVNLANASGSTPDEAVNLVTAALGAFQLQASEAARVADLMVTALNRTRLTVAQAGAAIQYVGATAYEQNIALDELLASAAAMAQAGIKSGSTIGTGMRQFLVDLQSPSKKLQEQFESLNLSTEELDVTTRGLPAVLDSLNNAGFGAAQAYEGLETRAAAAYLVLRNNTGLIDELRLQMAETGGATEANATAMESFSAQWQRFKNIVGESSEDQFKPITDGLRDIFKGLSDFKEANEQIYADTGQTPLQRFGNDLLTIRDNTGEVTYAFGDAVQGWEDGVNRWLMGSQYVVHETEDLETQIAVLSERIAEHTGKVVELEKEYQRLLVQEDSLRNNHDRMDAEMASLTSRFQELGLYLDDTKSQYDSLTDAVWSYINATQEALASDLAIRGNQLANQRKNYTDIRGQASTRLIPFENDSRLTQEEQILLRELRSGRSAQGEKVDLNRYRYIARRLSGAGSREDILGTSLGDAISNLVDAMGNVSSTMQAEGITRRQQESALAAGTPEGVQVRAQVEQIEALITQGRAERGDVRAATVREARDILREAQEGLDSYTPTSDQVRFFRSQRAELDSLDQALTALVTPTASERERAERDRREAERRGREDRPISFISPTAGGNISSRMGPRWGRQHKGIDIAVPVGTPVVVTADGVVKKVDYDKDGYGNYVVVDHGGETETRYAHLSDRSVVEGQIVKQGETLGLSGGARGAPGAGNSRGPHLHYEVRQKGVAVDPTKSTYLANPNVTEDAERYEQQAERARQRYQKALDSREVKLSEGALKLAIDNAAQATTSQAFSTAIAEAESALATLEDRLSQQAANELQAQGLGPLDPEYHLRLMQLEEDVQQRGEEYRQKVVDAIFENVENAFAAAELATATILREYDLAVRRAEARVSGLGYASMEGQVPDYMRQLAERRVAEGQESRDRARLSALPGQIGAQESALADAERRLALMQRTDQAYENQAQKVRELRDAIRELRDEQETLAIALSMADEMPKTLGEGLEKAIEAYREYHDLNRTLQEEVIFNMGGILENVHSQVNTFFTDIYTGSKSVLAAFGDMVLGIFRYLQQLAAQFVANQVFKVLLNLLGAAAGTQVTSGGLTADVGSGLPSGFTGPASYFGGKAEGGLHNPIRRFGGGKVESGVRAYDSTLALLARDEWVVNRSAAESVGDEFMSDLNRRGAQAVRDFGGAPTNLFQSPKQEANIYVVAPEQKPSIGPNDVLVVMRDDMLNGESRKLIKSISQGA